MCPSCQRNSVVRRKETRPQFPANDVGPLIDEEGKIAVRLHPLGEHAVDDRLRGRTDDERLLELLAPGVGDNRQFRSEPLDVLGLAMDEALRDEEGEVGVLVSRLLDEAIQSLLDLLPDRVPVRPDHHAAPDGGVIRQFGLLNDVLIPAGEIDTARRDAFDAHLILLHR